MNITKKIIRARFDKNITQKELADSINLSQQGYSRLEKRNENLTIKQIKAIASALGVDIRELLFDEKPSDCEKEIERLKKEIHSLKLELNIMEHEMLVAQKTVFFLEQILPYVDAHYSVEDIKEFEEEFALPYIKRRYKAKTNERLEYMVGLENAINIFKKHLEYKKEANE